MTTIAEGFIGTNKAALFFDHTGDGGKSNKYRNNNEYYGEYQANSFDRRSIAFYAGIACIRIAGLYVPLSFFNIVYFSAGIGYFLESISFGFFIFFTLSIQFGLP